MHIACKFTVFSKYIADLRHMVLFYILDGFVLGFLVLYYMKYYAKEISVQFVCFYQCGNKDVFMSLVVFLGFFFFYIKQFPQVF